MLRCFLSDRPLAVAAWLCVIGGVDRRAALLRFDGAGAMGVAASIWLRTGCVSIGVASRFLAIIQSSGSGNQTGPHSRNALIAPRSRALQTSRLGVEDAQAGHNRSGASSQCDAHRPMRLTRRF
jgi:hypothetical protein